MPEMQCYVVRPQRQLADHIEIDSKQAARRMDDAFRPSGGSAGIADKYGIVGAIREARRWSVAAGQRIDVGKTVSPFPADHENCLE